MVSQSIKMNAFYLRNINLCSTIGGINIHLSRIRICNGIFTNINVITTSLCEILRFLVTVC